MRRIGKIILRILLGLVITVLLLPVLLYIPFVQDAAVKFATRKAGEATGMTIEVGRLRLGFPLRLKVNDVTVIQANADTMLTARRAAVDVKLLPLLRKKVDVERIELDTAFYQMGNRDSLMWLRARLEKGRIAGAGFDLSTSRLSLPDANIEGVDVRMRILEDTTAKAPSDTTQSPFVIDVGRVRLARTDFSMEMMPTIDSLGCYIGEALLTDALIDLGRQTIHGHSLTIDSVAAAYIYPSLTDSVSPAPQTVESTPEPPSLPWTINADMLRLTARSALYAQRGAVPAAGFDPSYISARDIVIEIDSFYNRGTAVRVPLRRFEATERCGLPLHADGLFNMDSTAMTLDGFTVGTLHTTLRADARMGMGDLTADPNLPLSLKANGRIDPEDVAMAFPDMRAMLAPMQPLTLSGDIDGTAGQLNIYSMDIAMPGILRVNAHGSVDYPFDAAKTGGSVSLDGTLGALSKNRFPFLPIAHTPALTLQGDVTYYPGEASGAVEVTTSGGRIAAEGGWTARSEEYDAKVKLDRFPVHLFMPELGVGDVTAAVSVEGRGYNPMARSTAIDADVRIASAEYLKVKYTDIDADVTLHAGNASGRLTSRNPGADATVDFTALLDGDTVRYDLTGILNDINLVTLHLSDTINGGHATIRSSGFYNVTTQGMDVRADVTDLFWRIPGVALAPTSPISLALASEPSGADASLDNGDLALRFYSGAPLLQFVDSLSPAITEIMSEVDSMRINVRRLSEVIPRFALEANMGRDNVAATYLATSGITFNSLDASIRKDSLITMGADLLRLDAAGTRLDTINLNVFERGDYLVYSVKANSRPGTFDDFAHVDINGFAGFNRMSVFMDQHNIKGEQGFRIGVNASILDSVLTVSLVPRKPVIAYKAWTLNDSNFISYDLVTSHIDANLRLSQGDSYINIFTPAHVENEETDHGTHHAKQEEVMIQLADVALQDWLSINPFAPPVKGMLSANLSLGWQKPDITGKGTVSLTDLYYGKERVGSFDLDLNVETTPGGKLMADVGLMVDSVRTITARGVLNDSTLATPFLLDFDMIHFPLSVANPFLPAGTARLSGMLNGSMKITGDMANPRFDGYIDFDSAAVKVGILGSSFAFSDEKIPVDSNIVRFDGFSIYGSNDKPLTIDGIVDMRELSNVRVNLKAAADGMQIVNTERARGEAEIFGKAWIGLDASVRGNMSFMNVDASLSLLEGTNVTYVMTTTEQSIQQQGQEDMVRFVQFNDTTQVTKADSIPNTGMVMNLSADIKIQEGTTLTVNLNPGGSNKVQIQPEGDLDFSMTALNGMRLTGRLNINDGFVRYTPPLMSEKNFAFQEGSYVAFNGNVLNPVLNVTAVDVMKANVTQSGADSRLVNFDVSVAVTGTLEQMNVVFNLSTGDDITVQNELSSMSPEQRAQSAINLLLMGTYSGSGTQATTKLNNNPLFSFLTGQLNAWAANNIKGVDISFGMDQYDRTLDGTTSTTTSYSYRVSKSLFNDRFKIVVGGNYSTDADADENFAQNLINDIAFEYLLNRSGSMYIRIFRHTGFESILEGEITQTGVGFVLKRKINSLWDLFGIRRD